MPNRITNKKKIIIKLTYLYEASYFTERRENILAGLSWDHNIRNVKVIQEFQEYWLKSLYTFKTNENKITFIKLEKNIKESYCT